MQTEIITKLGAAELFTKEGNVLTSLDKDVWKVAAFDRIHGTNKHAIGFLENFGADIGAFPSIRILSGGIVDVKRRSYINPIN